MVFVSINQKLHNESRKKELLTSFFLQFHKVLTKLNTVLASMNCFFFNLSYNVMIMCEWHQLMYIAIITPSKPTTPPDSGCISPLVWQQSPKCQFFGQIKVRSWYLTGRFPLNAFCGLYFSHFIRPSLAYLTLPRSRPKRILGNSAIARAKNSCSFHFIFFL